MPHAAAAATQCRQQQHERKWPRNKVAFFWVRRLCLPAWLLGVGAGADAGAERSRPRSALGDDGDSNDKLCRCLRLWLQLLSAFN